MKKNIKNIDVISHFSCKNKNSSQKLHTVFSTTAAAVQTNWQLLIYKYVMQIFSLHTQNAGGIFQNA